MRKSQSFRSYQGIAGITAALMLPALAACSSSSSGGGQTPAEASASAAASAAASRLGISPLPSLEAGGHGPNGDITAPATNPPSKTSPGGSVVFPNVSKPDSVKFQNQLSPTKKKNKHVVRAVTYYPQFDQLQVYFDDKATSADKQRVYNYVVKHDPAAAGATTPSPAATTSASPTASAS